MTRSQYVFSAAGESMVVDLSGNLVGAVQVTGPFTGSLEIGWSLDDGENWEPLQATRTNDGVAITGFDGPGACRVQIVAGLRAKLRLRAVVLTSGTPKAILSFARQFE